MSRTQLSAPSWWQVTRSWGQVPATRPTWTRALGSVPSTGERGTDTASQELED